MPDRFPRGSEWRKWDLHLHPPGTSLSDGYAESDWPEFCETLEGSDVVAFGITDYFSFAGFKRARREFAERFPQSEKVLFPNLELRLNEHVNKAGDLVDLHVLLNPDIPDEVLDSFIAALPTQLTNDRHRHVRCSELEGEQFAQATVSRADLGKALDEVFGAWGPDDAIIIVPASNSGIRAEAGVQRKASLADELDKFVHAIFGGSQHVDWYLRTDRFEDQSQSSAPKPVFACSDAHDMAQLKARLGQTLAAEGDHRETTWVKADPTFEGLVQTLIEPSERVRIQPAQPDLKEPYKVISQVRFGGSEHFPVEDIELNPNLVSVIGSRSSGKSALLAYISHAVDPTYTERQQVESGVASDATAGPAAGLTWSDVSDITCEVIWGTGAGATGRVVYIPQNSLFTVSERPREITQKLLPTLFRMDPVFRSAHQHAEFEIDAANAEIRVQVERWFGLNESLRHLREQLRDMGDPAAVKAASDELSVRIQTLRAESELTPEEVVEYEAVVESLIELDAASARIQQDQRLLDAAVVLQADGSYTAGDEVRVRVALPSSLLLPAELDTELQEDLVRSETALTAQVRERIEQFRGGLDQRLMDTEASADRLREDSRGLIAKNTANSEIESLLQRKQDLDEHIRRIVEQQSREVEFVAQGAAAIEALRTALTRRDVAVAELVHAFESQDRHLDDMTFGIEHAIPEAALAAASAVFNRQENTAYFDRRLGEQINLGAVLADPGAFLAAIADGAQKLRLGTTPHLAAVEVFTISPDIQIWAELEGDRIGGFKPSSMTPGKQALFALTLIINESEDAWPLLLDQPEDDLDSRSIYASIVPFLMRRKRDRQIIMVSHDANLVVGADSEQVIVANRHGDDRPNRDNRTFAYLTGSLEWSDPHTEAEYVLEGCGTREHACDILDGGEEAFLKRRLKYKI